MWSAPAEQLPREDGVRYNLERDGRPMALGDVVTAWRNDAEFRAFWNQLLAATPYQAFRWETPAATTATLQQPFECVVLNSPALDRPPEREPFAEQFENLTLIVTSFPNLRGDATLVVPHPIAADEKYVHLATFVRSAPEIQQQSLWWTVGEAMQKRVGAKPVWLSTAGAGVAWLHVRLDDRPKYYSYNPYRNV